jgi:hypothetical protein
MLKQFLEENRQNDKETHETSITLIIYNYSVEDTMTDLYKQLENIKNIKHPQTKKKLNDRVYNFIKYIEDKKQEPSDKLNSLYLINDNILEHTLTKKEISTLKEFNKHKYYIIFDNEFHIDFLIDFFTNFNYYNSFECNKKEVKHTLLTKTKSKTNKIKSCSSEDDLITFIKENSDNNDIVIHGISTLLKTLRYKSPVFNKKLCNNDVITVIEEQKMKEKHIELEDVFKYLDDERKLHLLIYGKIKNEIKQAIEEYRVKKLYCHSTRLHLVKKQLSAEYYNFPIIIVDRLKDGDCSDRLLNEFKGVIGISYY